MEDNFFVGSEWKDTCWNGLEVFFGIRNCLFFRVTVPVLFAVSTTTRTNVNTYDHVCVSKFRRKIIRNTYVFKMCFFVFLCVS